MHSAVNKKKRERTIKIVRNIAIVLIPLIIIGLLGLRLAKDAKGMLAEADGLKAGLKTVISCVKEKDIDGAEAATANVDKSLASINKTLSSPIWKTTSKLPGVGKYVKSVNTLVYVAGDASDEMLKPALEVMKEYPLSGLKMGDGFSVTTINAYLDLLEDIAPKIDGMAAKMQTVELPFGKTKMISEYTQMLTKLTDEYRENGEYLPLCREFLGHGEDKIYLLAAQNSAEIRASGGFPGSVGTIRIEDGVLTIGDFRSVYDVLSERASSRAEITSQEISLYSDWIRLARDACYIPDFERVAQIWAYSYEDRNHETVDGVVSLTPAVIQKLLEYTGEVTISDGTVLNGDNATQVLQKDLYYKYFKKGADSNDYVDSLFAETAKLVMAKLVSDFDTNRIAQYSKIFTDGGKDRTIMMWMADDTAQEYVRNAGCSGALNFDPAKPEAGVFFSGSNGSKLGWFVDMDANIDDVVVNDDDSRTYDITVEITNTISNSDMRGVSEYIIGLYEGCIDGYLHLFAPSGGTISDVETSNYMRMRMTEYEELELAYNTDFRIEPGETVVVTYKVTTAPGISEPLEIVKTPTLQEYR